MPAYTNSSQDIRNACRKVIAEVKDAIADLPENQQALVVYRWAIASRGSNVADLEPIINQVKDQFSLPVIPKEKPKKVK